MTSETASREHHENQVAVLQRKITYLKDQVEWFRRQIFGQRSEKVVEPSDEVLYLPGLEPQNEPAITEREVKTHTRRVPKRNGQDAIKLPDDLPIERQVIDLPEQQKICPETRSS